MKQRSISFRPINNTDMPFLSNLYASTRADEIAQTGWPKDQQDAFLKQQHETQHRYYTENFKEASFDLILKEDKPIGRLYLDRRREEIRIIDISLLPQSRGKGIGGAIIRDILAEGKHRNLPVTIHVEKNNPALRLYHRLNFQEIEDLGIYLFMKWSPNGEEGSTVSTS